VPAFLVDFACTNLVKPFPVETVIACRISVVNRLAWCQLKKNVVKLGDSGAGGKLNVHSFDEKVNMGVLRTTFCCFSQSVTAVTAYWAKPINSLSKLYAKATNGSGKQCPQFSNRKCHILTAPHARKNQQNLGETYASTRHVC
jgi:hypothetical protein